MSDGSRSCPASTERVLDLYFMEHRAKLIDIAAFLDRVDRASDAGGAQPDFRLAAFREALEVLREAEAGRARRVLDLLSDPTDEPIKAAGEKGAHGAYPGDSA